MVLVWFWLVESTLCTNTFKPTWSQSHCKIVSQTCLALYFYTFRFMKIYCIELHNKVLCASSSKITSFWSLSLGNAGWIFLCWMILMGSTKYGTKWFSNNRTPTTNCTRFFLAIIWWNNSRSTWTIPARKVCCAPINRYANCIWTCAPRVRWSRKNQIITYYTIM